MPTITSINTIERYIKKYKRNTTRKNIYAIKMAHHKSETVQKIIKRPRQSIFIIKTLNKYLTDSKQIANAFNGYFIDKIIINAQKRICLIFFNKLKQIKISFELIISDF